MNIDKLNTLHDRIAADAGITHCRVRCESCGREERVNGGNALRHGWPMCCGYTMTLVTKKAEQAAAKEGR